LLLITWDAKTPDREPVKFGIALLGLVRQERDIEIFRTLGRHADKLLDRAVVALAEGDKSKQLSFKRIELQKTPGREVVFERPDEHGSYYQLSRVYLRRSGQRRLYQANVRTRLREDLHADYVRKFLDSLALVD
jgi:hypothetical protein